MTDDEATQWILGLKKLEDWLDVDTILWSLILRLSSVSDQIIKRQLQSLKYLTGPGIRKSFKKGSGLRHTDVLHTRSGVKRAVRDKREMGGKYTHTKFKKIIGDPTDRHMF